MKNASKFAEGVQGFALKGSFYCLSVLLLNLQVAFSDIRSTRE